MLFDEARPVCQHSVWSQIGKHKKCNHVSCGLALWQTYWGRILISISVMNMFTSSMLAVYSTVTTAVVLTGQSRLLIQFKSHETNQTDQTITHNCNLCFQHSWQHYFTNISIFTVKEIRVASETSEQVYWINSIQFFSMKSNELRRPRGWGSKGLIVVPVKPSAKEHGNWFIVILLWESAVQQTKPTLSGLENRNQSKTKMSKATIIRLHLIFR